MDPLHPSHYGFGWNMPTPILHDFDHDDSGLNVLSLTSTQHDSIAQPADNPGGQNNTSIPEVEEMELDADAEQVPELSRSNDNVRSEHSQAKRGDQSWEQYRNILYELYMEKDHSLARVVEYMKSEHGFERTQKQYKDKFKTWKWTKRLQGQVAQWMVKKGNDREAMYGKNTVFSWQGQVWTRDQAESTASRTRKFVLVESPPGMSVKTPKSPNEIYNEIHSPAGRAELRQSRQNSTELLSKTFTLPLSWNGNTRENLSQLHDMARESFYRGDFDNAETGYMNALEGHRYLLAPTHEDTVKVAYELANFYAEQRRMTDADNVIEELSQEFVERWGIKHRRTTQHVIKVVELLNSWNRETDALAFLARAHDVAGRAERDFEDTGRAQNNTRRIRKPKSRIPTHREQLESIREDIVAHPNVSMVDYGINIARRYAATDEPAVEAFLKVTEDICNQNGPDLAVQGLRARAERLTWYQKRNTITQNENAFTSTKAFFQTLWNGWPWDREKIRSLDMLEASMEVASALLKASFSADATTIFRDVERKAAHVFGPDDERTIWTLITIGIVHQNARNWREAKPWFEQALAAALQAYDDDDGITKSLETAMEKEHFSYISEEGRPFKTIFGVSGITIRPNRLHLE